MMSIPIGPLALPAAPLLLLVSAMLAGWVADRLARRQNGKASASSEPVASSGASGAEQGAPARAAEASVEAGSASGALLQALLASLVVARAVHVALHLDGYTADPWALLDVRDGGWNALAGVVGGVGWLAWQARRHASLRTALAGGATVGLVLWSAGTAGLDGLTPRGLPDLTLVELGTGRTVRLHDVAAQRPVVLNLWATWCGPCRREMPVLAAAQVRHPEVSFVFANQGEQATAVQRYLEGEGLRLSGVLLDPGSALGPALGSGGLPTTVVFDRQGRRVGAHMGALNAAALSALLKPALAP